MQRPLFLLPWNPAHPAVPAALPPVDGGVHPAAEAG